MWSFARSSHPLFHSAQYSAPPGAPPSSTRPQSGQYGTPPGPPPRPQSGSYAPSQGAPYQQQSQYPGQQQPQYPGQQPQYPGQQSQYGQPPQAPQQQFGGSSADASFIQGILEQCVRDQNIQAFYPPGSLGPIAQRVAQSGALDRVCRDWQVRRATSIGQAASASERGTDTEALASGFVHYRSKRNLEQTSSSCVSSTLSSTWMTLEGERWEGCYGRQKMT